MHVFDFTWIANFLSALKYCCSTMRSYQLQEDWFARETFFIVVVFVDINRFLRIQFLCVFCDSKEAERQQVEREAFHLIISPQHRAWQYRCRDRVTIWSDHKQAQSVWRQQQGANCVIMTSREAVRGWIASATCCINWGDRCSVKLPSLRKNVSAPRGRLNSSE